VKVFVIVNPVSGAGAAPDTGARRADRAAAVLAERGVRAEVVVSARPGHIRDLTAQAVGAGADLVIVWGGDGSVNEAGTALADTDTALGIVRAGSGNGLARALGVSKDPSVALTQALRGRSRRIDAGELNGRLFLNLAGIGFDAHVARLFNQLALGCRGAWPYLTTALREAAGYVPLEYDVSLDGAATRCRAFVIVFANGREYGNGAIIAPDARLDDGWLDVLIADDRPFWANVRRARHLFTASAPRAVGVTLRQIRGACVSAGAQIEYHVDGESGTTDGAIVVRTRPACLSVRC
jgi:YegS/Rv2252/BmrU family lipid kinase